MGVTIGLWNRNRPRQHVIIDAVFSRSSYDIGHYQIVIGQVVLAIHWATGNFWQLNDKGRIISTLGAHHVVGRNANCRIWLDIDDRRIISGYPRIGGDNIASVHTNFGLLDRLLKDRIIDHIQINPSHRLERCKCDL